MARSYETALAELENKRGELEALSTISEEEVCYVYNVDSKSESKHPIKYTLYFHKIENSISTLVKS